MLTHLCFTPSHVLAFNDKTAIIADADTELHCAVPGKVLLDMLEGCGAEIALEQKDAELVIKDKGSTIRLPILQPDAFVFDPDQFDKAAPLCSLTPELIVGLELAASYSNLESIRANLTGVTFDASESGAGAFLLLYSTDNVTLTKVSVVADFKTKKRPRGIIPKDACDLIVKTFKDLQSPEGATLKLGDGFLLAEIADGVRVITKLVAAEPADFEKMITENGEGAENIDCPESLFAAAKRASILTATDPDRVLELSSQSGFLSIKAKGRLGELETKIKTKGAVDGNPYLVDPDMLARAQPWAAQIGLGAKALILSGALGEGDDSIEYMVARKGG